MKFLHVITTVLLLSCALSASAQQDLIADAMFENGIEAFRHQDFDAVKTHWHRAANRGHLRAMVGLAQLYQSGQLGQPDTEAAKKWYYKAAKQDSALAQFQLSQLLLADGDYRLAEKWLLKAAENQHRGAQMTLAELYEQGGLLEHSITSASRWYQSAAENGVVDAQLKMVDLCLLGEGVAHDESQAFSWAVKASGSGDARAKYLLGMMYSTGTGTVYSPEIARLWLQEAADEGAPNAQRLLDALEIEQRKPGVPKPLDRDFLVASGF